MPNLSWTEPESAANTDYQPIYPYNNVQQTEAGHSFEMDDTPTRERIRLTHRANTFIEMHPNGDEVHKIFGNGYEIIIKDKNVSIKGVCNITIEGNSVMTVKGDSYINCEKNVYQDVQGSVKQAIRGGCEQTIVGDYDLRISGNMNINASNVNINSNLKVTGDIGSEQSITAQGNIGAKQSVTAIKSVETKGFMTASTTIEAGVSVFGTDVYDIFGSVEQFRMKVNTHVHSGVKGGPNLTQPPTRTME
jgi:hypothetical protein